MPDASPRLLWGVFTALRDGGAALGVRDYLVGLDALCRYGGFPDDLLTTDDQGRTVVATRIRNHMVEFCQTLWARTDEERLLVERTLRGAIPPPPPQLVKRLRSILDTTSLIDDPRPARTGRHDPESEGDTSSHDEAGKKDTASRQAKKKGRKDDSETTVTASFSAAGEGGHLPLPALSDFPETDDRTFAFRSSPLLSERFLAMCWRRFRLPTRAVPSDELDVAATIGEISRSGFLIHPVYRTRRQNTASLLFLIDVGAAMAPWRAAEREMLASLRPSLSRLSSVSVRFFDAVPRRCVYVKRPLREPEAVEDWLGEEPKTPLVVLSDAGAARGAPDTPRETRILQFLARARGPNARPVVWLNPMPTGAWRCTPAAAIAGSPFAAALPLTREAILLGVDILRGERTA